MVEKPIIFSGPMVRAILEGRKTQTRRVVKPQPACGCIYEMNGNGDKAVHWNGDKSNALFVPVRATSASHLLPSPYGQPGDRLWVRETFNEDWSSIGIIYRADGGSAIDAGYPAEPKWKPSIFMPRKYCRLLLDVKAVRVERLQDISPDDAMAEGAREFPDIAPGPIFGKTTERWSMADPENSEQCMSGPYWAFANFWSKINAKPGTTWNENPWVWVVEFERVTDPAGQTE